jgi:tetratricopeptide (TPR) repeat protein
MQFIIKILLIILLMSGFSYSAGSSDNEPKESTNMLGVTSYDSAVKKINKAKKLEKKNKQEKAEKLYNEALVLLFKSYDENPLNPDTLNYLGFANRKTGKMKDAETYYLLGLNIDPNHNGINEYLGELYLATNRIQLANERLAILKNCNCEEYNELKELIDGTKKSKY